MCTCGGGAPLLVQPVWDPARLLNHCFQQHRVRAHTLWVVGPVNVGARQVISKVLASIYSPFAQIRADLRQMSADLAFTGNFV